MTTPNPRRPLALAALGSGRAVARPDAKPVKSLASSAVFNGATEIGIEHHGELYRLKITRQGKLILTK
jgi:hemin uptake protein HemP